MDYEINLVSNIFDDSINVISRDFREPMRLPENSIERLQEEWGNFEPPNPDIENDESRASRSSLRKMLSEEQLTHDAIHQEWERRAAVDVGSGSTKICISDVDVRTNQIMQIVFEKSFAVPYQAYLETDGLFGEAIREFGLKTFSEIRDIFDEYHVDRIAAIATEAFRKSPNGEWFAGEVQKIGIPLRVISQEEEGAVGFYSAVAASEQDSKDLLVWDIGTGSFQIAAVNPVESLAVYMQSFGSVPFKNYIIKEIQKKDPASVITPNPISKEDWEKADGFARKMGRKALPLIKDKIRALQGSVVGIGRLFANSIGGIVEQKGVITRDDLRAYIRACLNKTDDELNDPFSNVNVSNCILVLGVMKALHMYEIDIVETTSTKGILTYSNYWNSIYQT